MKKRIQFLFSLLCISILVFTACSREQAPIQFDQDFDGVVSAYTSGVISNKSTIKVQLAAQIQNTQQVEDLDIVFSPKLNGKLHFLDDRTLEFIPSESLPQGTHYNARIVLDDLLADPIGKPFRFSFETKQQNFSVRELTTTTPNPTNPNQRRITGFIETADYASSQDVEEIMQASLFGKTMSIDWDHDAEAKKHEFKIDLDRTDDAQYVNLSWDGAAIYCDRTLEHQVELTAKGEFALTSANHFDANREQFIKLGFSEPIDPAQDLEGLIRINERPAGKYLVDGSSVTVYPYARLSGDINLNVSPGIKTYQGQALAVGSKHKFKFSSTKPEVKLTGKGVITPKGKSIPFVFEATSLSAIDVRVIKIHEKNVQQFLQINQLDGSDELKRVGSVIVAQERIELDPKNKLDLTEWNHHSINLANIINPEPGAIYEIAIGFKPEYSLYECGSSDDENQSKNEKSHMLDVEANWHTYTPPSESSGWDYYYDDEEYDGDPCVDEFYSSQRVAKRNILASDLGIIAKQGTTDEIFVAVSSLKSTQPVGGVNITLFDYQQQPIASKLTDGDGEARLKLDRKPFIIVAEDGDQRGYLRIDDASSMSMSMYDVAGQKYHKGIKGMIYGERGVWRPGDDMFLTFILEDRAASLPANHPVELEIFDPKGRVIAREVSTAGVNGMYDFVVKTTDESPTGNYLARVRVGGAEFQKTLKVETILPNRLKINLDFPSDILTANNAEDVVPMNVKWLHGAIASNLKTTVDLTLKQSKTQFKTHRDFTFDDPVRKFRTSKKKLFDGQINEDGNTEIGLSEVSTSKEAPGMLTASFSTKVFEPSGAFSTDRFKTKYSPYDAYVGVKTPKGDAARDMLLTDEDHEVKLIVLDPDGKPIQDKELDVALYKVKWKWWYDKDKDDVAAYRGKLDANEIMSGTARTDKNGRASWKMQVKFPDWGRYLVRACDGDGHCTGKIVYIDWPGWAGRAAEDNPGGASMLVFSKDKEKYNVGDDMKISIPTPNKGRALVTVESGEEVLESYWVNAKKGTTKVTIPTDSRMAPNAYVSVSLLQPHEQTANDLPIRMHGVIPVQIEDPATRLYPEIVMADQLRPNKEFEVTVKESRGGPMTYTLAVVDEGLLDLTRHKTPDPWSHFFQRSALTVKTWDVFNYVLGAYGKPVSTLLSIGGDAAGPLVDNPKQDRFKPVVIYEQPFELKKGETQTHKLQMPNYVGSVRVMVVARQGIAYGSTEKAVPVKEPLMAYGTVPRVLKPNEDINIPVTIFAMDDNIKTVSVTVSSNDMLEAKGDLKKTMNFKRQGEQTINFNFKTPDRLGKAQIEILATSGSKKATYKVDVNIVAPNEEETRSLAGVFSNSKSHSEKIESFGIAGTNKMTLEVSALPPMNLGKRLGYLIGYPYGCVEQTTSKTFPQVYLTDLIKLPEAKQKEVSSNVKRGINRLQRFQLPNGSMTYWPGNPQANDWATNYAGHCLVEAKRSGFNVPNEMLNQLLSFQKERANNWKFTSNKQEQKTQAYRLFMLALADKAELGAMNRMRNEGKIDNISSWYLAAAYQLAGQQKIAQQLADKAQLNTTNYVELSQTFGSGLRDKAIILQCASILGKRAESEQLLQEISKQLSGDKWINTHATAYSLVAFANFSGVNGKIPKYDFEYRINEGKWVKASSSKALWQLELNQVKNGTIEFKTSENVNLYSAVNISGVPTQFDTKADNKTLDISVFYSSIDGEKINPEAIEQGTDFEIAVSIKNTGSQPVFEVSLDQLFPSGWEIANARLDGGSIPDGADYQDIRDDRVYTFFDLKSKESKTFTITVNAAYLGKYYLPGTNTEAMYDNTIYARTAGSWTEVIAKKTN